MLCESNLDLTPTGSHVINTESSNICSPGKQLRFVAFRLHSITEVTQAAQFLSILLGLCVRLPPRVWVPQTLEATSVVQPEGKKEQRQAVPVVGDVRAQRGGPATV